jgi:hypothetical protein
MSKNIKLVSIYHRHKLLDLIYANESSNSMKGGGWYLGLLSNY